MLAAAEPINVGEEHTFVKADVASALRTLVATFDLEPLLNGKKMRGLLELDRDAFRIAALSILHTFSEERGCRYIVLLLWTRGLMIPLLSDVSIPLSVAIAVTSTVAKIDPQLSIRLTSYLIGSMLGSQDLDDVTACRLIELLGSVADSTGLQSFLRQILMHPSARIRSKASLLIGRGPSGARTLSKMLLDSNERVRANATEALWTGDTEDALPIFTQLLNDKNHRVAGNAILGLYRLGEIRSIPAIRALNDHQDPKFRSVGVWAMGETKDPRYLTRLGRMLTDPSGPSRKSVFQALNAIKKAAIERASHPPFRVTILRMLRTPSGAASVQLVVEGNSLSTPPIPATGFHITADRKSLDVLTFVESRHDATTVSLIIPRSASGNQAVCESLDAAILKCLESKLEAEPWSISRYTTARELAADNSAHKGDGAATRPARASVEAEPGYMTDCTTLQSILAGSHAPESRAGWLGAVTAVLQQEPPGRASRHLITFIDSTAEIDSAAFENFLELAAVHRFSIHVLSCEVDKRIARLCSATGGNYLCVDSADCIGLQFQLLYAAMKRLFSVTFISPANNNNMPTEIGIEVYNATQIGQASSALQRAR